jgi:hypothetical protein
MDEKQEIAFLKAKVEILEKNQEKQDKRIEQIEKAITDKLDVLIKESAFVKGVIKALAGFITFLTLISPFMVKYFLG